MTIISLNGRPAEMCLGGLKDDAANEDINAMRELDKINPTTEEWLKIAERSGAPEYMKDE